MRLLLIFFLAIWSLSAQAQVPLEGRVNKPLKPGFVKEEYLEVLRLSSRQWDSLSPKVPEPRHFKRFYRSRVVGLDNRYDLSISADSVAILTIRGTTLKSVSWLENFYAAMVPATGQLMLPDSTSFPYKLADDERAAVHVGWLVGMACIANDALPKLDSLTNTGIKGLMISGHSQGGAIAYLMTAYLRYRQLAGTSLQGVRIKAYCSAGPKPGNLYFAYDYESWAQQGWSYNVVNTADWVPETPMSVQQMSDFNTTNPFVVLKPALRKQKFPKNLFFGYVFSSMEKPPRRAVKRYQKYMGKVMGKYVAKNLPGLQVPGFATGNNYVRVGPTVVLKPEPAYFALYPENTTEIRKVFTHHLFDPYYYLAERLPEVRP